MMTDAEIDAIELACEHGHGDWSRRFGRAVEAAARERVIEECAVAAWVDACTKTRDARVVCSKCVTAIRSISKPITPKP